MELDDLFSEDRNLSVKLATPKFYVRMMGGGEAQLVRVEPLKNDDGLIIPGYAMLFVDNDDEPLVVERGVADAYLSADNHIALETLMHWKHNIRN